MDRTKLQEYLNLLRDRYTAAEIVDLLESAGILDVDDILNYLEDYIIEGKNILLGE